MSWQNLELPPNLSLETFSKACKLVYEYEDADWPSNADSEGAKLQRPELVLRLHQLFFSDRQTG